MSLLKLKDEVSESSCAVNPDDVLEVKGALNKFGLYKTPNYGMTKFVDSQMIDGIKKFQQDNGLKVDGVMKPGGETEKKMNSLFDRTSYKDAAKFVPNGTGLGRAVADGLPQFLDMRKKGYDDKYKHSYINCSASQKGLLGASAVGFAGAGREAKQMFTGENKPKDSWQDMKANMYGMKQGLLNPLGNCDSLTQKRYNKYHRK